MVRRPPRGSVLGGQPPSRQNLGGMMVLWRSCVPCARRRTPYLRSKVRSMVSRGSPRGSFGSDGRGRILASTWETRLGLVVAATHMRPGLGGRWLTTGDFLPSSICSCATEARSRPCRSSSEASRRARRRRWKTGAPGGSAFVPPLVRKSPISLSTIGRRRRSGSTSRSFVSR